MLGDVPSLYWHAFCYRVSSIPSIYIFLYGHSWWKEPNQVRTRWARLLHIMSGLMMWETGTIGSEYRLKRKMVVSGQYLLRHQTGKMHVIPSMSSIVAWLHPFFGGGIRGNMPCFELGSSRQHNSRRTRESQCMLLAKLSKKVQENGQTSQ